MLYRPNIKGDYWNAKRIACFLMLGNLLVLTSLSCAEPDRKPSSIEEYAYSEGIVLHAKHFDQAIKVFKWLDLIRLTEIGAETLNAIDLSGHQLTIYHSETALYSAGATGAPLSSNLTNGKGENAYIKFYLDMDSFGTNCVLGKNGHYIEYTALQNLFHELSHARHKMNGTWLYFDSEGQAIRDENRFRVDWAKYRYKTFASRYEDAEDEDIVRTLHGSCQSDRVSSISGPFARPLLAEEGVKAVRLIGIN